MAKKKWEIIETATGRVIENDDDDVLRSGQTLRVPMMFRDSMSPLQRSVAEDKAMRDAARSFGLDDALALHKPGQRFVVDAAARARVEQARAEGIREMCDAWKNPPTGMTMRPPGESCSSSGCGMLSGAAVTMIPSKGANSGHPR